MFEFALESVLESVSEDEAGADGAGVVAFPGTWFVLSVAWLVVT